MYIRGEDMSVTVGGGTMLPWSVTFGCGTVILLTYWEWVNDTVACNVLGMTQMNT